MCVARTARQVKMTPYRWVLLLFVLVKNGPKRSVPACEKGGSLGVNFSFLEVRPFYALLSHSTADRRFVFG